MKLTGEKKLIKLKLKNKGNKNLIVEIDRLISTIEKSLWKTPADIRASRPDADCVHADGFYIFNIAVHRTMIMIEFDGQEASIVWAGTHDKYEATFKNNKNSIAKWLRERNYIE